MREIIFFSFSCTPAGADALHDTQYTPYSSRGAHILRVCMGILPAVQNFLKLPVGLSASCLFLLILNANNQRRYIVVAAIF